MLFMAHDIIREMRTGGKIVMRVTLASPDGESLSVDYQRIKQMELDGWIKRCDDPLNSYELQSWKLTDQKIKHGKI